MVKTGFSFETFLFSKITFQKSKHSHTLTTTRLNFPTSTITFQKKKSPRYSKLLNSTIRVLFLKTLQWLGPAHTSPGSPGRGLMQLDWPKAMTRHKLVIPTKGIMILVFWEKSFKSMEADYSNRLARSFVASCGEIPPSPWIRCDKIKSPYQRCQFLGTQK